MEAGDQVVELNRPKGEKRRDVQVDAGAKRGCKGILTGRQDHDRNTVARASALSDGLMPNSDEGVHEGSNLGWKGQLRSKQIGLHMSGTGSRRAAVMSAKIRFDADERKNSVGCGKFIPVQIGVFGNGSRHSGACERTIAYLIVGQRRTQVGISGKELQLLRERRRARGERKQQESQRPAKTVHEDTLDAKRFGWFRSRCPPAGSGCPL